LGCVAHEDSVARRKEGGETLERALSLANVAHRAGAERALLSGPVVALAIVALVKEPATPLAGIAEWVAAGVLAGSALFVVFNEGIANWQALWFGGLLLMLALTAYRATPAQS